MLQLHKETYRKYWRWSEAALNSFLLNGYIETVFGWRLHQDGLVNERCIKNFPMQGNGAEMLRIACIRLVEAGVRICAPVHDAVLIEAPEKDIDDVASFAQKMMAKASADILNGFELSTDVKTIKSTERFLDEKGEKMWFMINEILGEIKTSNF